MRANVGPSRFQRSTVLQEPRLQSQTRARLKRATIIQQRQLPVPLPLAIKVLPHIIGPEPC